MDWSSGNGLPEFMQDEHTEDPVAHVYSPVLQVLQEVLPAWSWNMPNRQSVHPEARSAAPMAVPYLPGGHAVHADMLSEPACIEYVPIGHSLQETVPLSSA